MAELFLGGTVDPATHERTGDDVRLDTDDFTTHGVIVGMTGSGKTGLGVVLIEEVLSAGLPALLIDPKGDLTNLCLTFPGLSASEFRPWVDPAQAEAAGATPEGFASQQAELWTKGMLGWGYTAQNIATLRATADFTIYTPGSQSGVPVNIVGSLQVPVDSAGEAVTDAEILGDEIEGYVTGLLGLVGIESDPLSSREHILLSNLVNHSWSQGKALDLATLVGMVGNPPIRKLGVFELDQFFPPDDRMALAMKLNGLLASPSFAAWADGPALDVQSMLYSADGSPRCAIVTTSHLSDDERQFVTSLVLAKVVTWMRRQSGVTDLRALVYMDEVAGYLPPTANPPTKKPIMTLMKQARAFGVGMVLSTQNPVDIDYKALSNAGTWMIGRLSTERDKARLLEGLTSAAGGVDVAAVDATISGLAQREFVLRTPGADTTSVFTTRWAMSYLRGPMTRDQISTLMHDRRDAAATAPPSTTPTPGSPTDPDVGALADDESTVMPEVADGTAVRYVDAAAPWFAEVGGDEQGTRLTPVIVARIRLRYDDTKADLVHDEEYECVLADLGEVVDVEAAVAVDYDERDLRAEPVQPSPVYRMTAAKLANKTFFTGVERDLADHLYRTRALTIAANKELNLYGRPGEDDAAFEQRCAAAADDLADVAMAKLRDKYEAKVDRIRDQIAAAEDRVGVLEQEAAAKRNSELLSTAGSLLGGLLGGKSRSTMLGKLGTAAGRRGRSSAAGERVDAAENKVARLNDQLEELEADLADELVEIESTWAARAAAIEPLEIGLEKSDVKVSHLTLAWLPTP